VTREWLLRVFESESNIVSWIDALDLPVIREYTHEAGGDGANWADDVMAQRSCPSEVGLLYVYEYGKWQYSVTVEGDPAGLLRCTRHAH
jgi:hypothetical protein